MRDAPYDVQNPWRSRQLCQQLVVAAFAAAQPVEAVGQDASFEDGVEGGGEPARSQAAHSIAIALSGVQLRVPARGCLPSGGLLHAATRVSAAGRDARKPPFTDDS
jgi:hypothetical protein